MNPQDQDEIHYYESHVTIKPVEGEKLVKFKAISHDHRFHVATFVDDSSGPDTMICTGRSKAGNELTSRMYSMVKTLQKEGFAVTRYKLESTILDSRLDDTHLPLA